MEPESSLPVPAEDSSAPKQGEFFPASDFIELEKARIASFDRRTEVARAAVEADRESEKNLFAYHMKRLDNTDAQIKREHKFASRFIWACLIVSILIGCFLVSMAFFGSLAQQAMAVIILGDLLKPVQAGTGRRIGIRQGTCA
jgi:hypothetical protein